METAEKRCGGEVAARTPSGVKGRYAPSPTGRMHLGNVASALLSWLCAKSEGGEWLLRIEDLDPQRCRESFARQLEDDLLRLGLVWDEGGYDADGGRYRQSCRSDLYAAALERLQDCTYPCYCTRAELLSAARAAASGRAAAAEAASGAPGAGPAAAGRAASSPAASGRAAAGLPDPAAAPHETDGRVVYPGTCRGLAPSARPAGRAPSTRLIVPDRDIRFTDGHYGPQCFNLARDCGDFILRRSDGVFAYQLAVVVDDALMGVTQVVRGRDLLLSTAQQLYLYELLGYSAPSFFHTPLLCAPDGRRLCKRDSSTDLGELFARFTPEEIIGRAAFLLGIIKEPHPCTPVELLKVFDPSSLPTDDICIRPFSE